MIWFPSMIFHGASFLEKTYRTFFAIHCSHCRQAGRAENRLPELAMPLFESPLQACLFGAIAEHCTACRCIEVRMSAEQVAKLVHLPGIADLFYPPEGFAFNSCQIEVVKLELELVALEENFMNDLRATRDRVLSADTLARIVVGLCGVGGCGWVVSPFAIVFKSILYLL